MRVRRGEVVIIDHPFSHATGSKVRLALIVQSDRRNSMLTETIVALITKNIKYALTDPTQFLIDIGTPEGKASGLTMTSSVKCGKLYTIDENLIRKKIGVLSAVLTQKMNDCLRAALDL